MTQTQPQFKVGDRFWTHYDYQWGTVKRVGNTDRDRTHGVTGSKMDDTTWYEVQYDNGSTNILDDAHGNWDMARMVPPHIAARYGYGDDPLACEACGKKRESDPDFCPECLADMARKRSEIDKRQSNR